MAQDIGIKLGIYRNERHPIHHFFLPRLILAGVLEEAIKVGLRAFLAIHFVVANGPQFLARIVWHLAVRGQEIIPLLLRAIVHEVAVEHQRPGLVLHTVQLADRVFVVLGVALDVGKHVHGSLRRALKLTERLDDAHVIHRPPPVIIAVVVAEANLHILRAGWHVHANGLVLGEDILIKDGDFLGFPAIEGDSHRGILPVLALAVMVVEFHIHPLLPRHRDGRAL